MWTKRRPCHKGPREVSLAVTPRARDGALQTLRGSDGAVRVACKGHG